MTNLRSLAVAQRRRQQSGGMLIEILVGMTIMVLIVGPITMAFVALFRSGPAVTEELNRSADAQRIGSAWTKDVQNVETGGINAGSGCNSGITGTQEVNLVSFRWNSTDDAVARGELPKTASWVAVGAGENLELRRRYCEGEEMKSEDVLATHVGISGSPITTVVHGPNTASPMDFCPLRDLGGGNYISDACTIVIDGSFKYDLTVSRRVADRTGGVAALPPPAPTITGAAGRNTYITVAWTPPVLSSGQPPITAYRAFAYLDPNGAPVASAEVDGASTSVDIEGVTNDTPYWVRVQAQNSAQWGELSAPFGAITPTPTAPDAPTITSVEALNGQASVTWTAPLNNGGLAITEWQIWANPGSGPEVGPVTIAGSAATAGVITGLQNGTSYTITVAAVNALGVGVRSDPSTALIPYGPAAAPSAVVAQAGDATAKVRWTPPADGNGRPIIGYTILTYKGLNQTTPMNQTGVYKTVAEAGCAATCEWTVSVTNADYYRFAVRPRTDVGGGATLEGTVSALSTVLGSQYGAAYQAPHVRPSTTPSAPGAPTLAIATGTNSGTYKQNATVTLPTDNGAPAHSIQVEYDRAPTSSPSSWTTQSATTAATTSASGATQVVTIDNVPAGYLYRVRARVANRGEWTNTGDRWSSYSGNSGSVTGAGVPSAPRNVVVTRPSGSFGKALTVAFDAPSDSGGATITSYTVSCTAPSGTPATRTVTSAGSVSVSGDDVRDGRDYSCSVAAVNASGTGAAGTTGATARPYGECTLRASQTQHIKEGSGVQTTTNAFWVRQRWQNFFGTNQNYREAGLIRWTWTSNCANVAAAMPSTAYVASATFNANIESTQDYDHDIVRNTSAWSSSTQWSNQPSYGSALGSWSARSTGMKSLSNASLLTAVREMKAGTTDFGLQVRNPTTDCYLCSGDSAKYTGATGSVPPQLVMTFYSQGA